MTETNERKFANIKINESIKKFSSTEKLKEFLSSELKYWEWLQASPELAHWGSELFNILYRTRLEALIQKSNSNNQDLALGNDGAKYITQDSIDGKLVEKAREKYGNVVAAYTLYYLCDESGNKLSSGSHLAASLKLPQNMRNRDIASHITISRMEILSLTKEASKKAITALISDVEKETNNAIETIATKTADAVEKTKDLDKQREEDRLKIIRRLRRREQAYKRFARSTRDDASRELGNSLRDLRSAKEAYHDQVDLDASVEYWTRRKRSHMYGKYGWLTATLLSILLTFTSLIGYYGFGGASEIAKVVIPSKVKNQNQTNPLPASTNTTEANATAASNNQNNHETRLIVADLAGAMLLITLLAVIIRVSLRQFNTHSHFVLEASEKVTHTKTYLALLNEGKLKSDEDRRIILESLFRSSQPNITTDSQFSSPIELILKTIGDKRTQSI